MTVGFIPFRPGLHTGNLRWCGKFAGRQGVFPPTHPAAPRSPVFQPGLGSQCGNSPALQAFRARGYWASCFPEGDGITFQPLSGQDEEQCLADVRACWPEWLLLNEADFSLQLQSWEKAEAERDRQRRRAFIESKERAATGLCSTIIRFNVFCTRPIGHKEKHQHIPVEPPKKRCCATCGNWILPGKEHRCGEGVCL